MKSFIAHWRDRLKKRKLLSEHKRLSDLNKKLVFTQSGRKIPSFAQLRYIFVMFSERELWFMRIFVAVFFIVLIVFGGRYYFRNTEAVAVSGGDYKEAVVGAPQYVNPILSQTSDVDTDLSRLIFSSLFAYNDKQELVADLVTSHAMSDDQKTYTFYLRQDVKWHDGVPFTANDVVFTLLNIQDPAFKSPLAPSLKGVAVNKIDDFTFNMVLKEPFAPFLSGLTFGILPEHLWVNILPENSTLAELNLKPIGTGRFEFDTLVKDKSGNVKSYVLKRNDDYYADKSYLDTVTFSFFADILSAVDALRVKDVQGLGFISQEDKKFLEEKKVNLNFHSLRLPQYAAIFFNQKKSDVLNDLAVRQALALSFDRQSIVDQALGGAGEVIYSPILPGYLGHNPEGEKWSLDAERARKILDAAGWVLLEGEEVRHKGDTQLHFTITTVDQAEYLTALRILQESWKQIGIAVDFNIITANEIQSKVIKPRDYEALLFGEIVGTDPDPYPFWHSTQAKHPGLNLAVFSNDDMDQLLEEARQTTDAAQRRVKYLHFQNILAEELPAILLYNPLYSYAVTSEVKGVESTYITVPADRFNNIHKWYIKTDRRWR